MTYFTIRVGDWTGRRRAQTLERQLGEIRGDGAIEVEIFSLLPGLLSGWKGLRGTGSKGACSHCQSPDPGRSRIPEWPGHGAALIVVQIKSQVKGAAIDRGHRRQLSLVVTVALLIGVALRVASGWATCAVLAANTAGAAVGGRYYPVLMSVMYDRAKCSESDYQFHLSAEAGWDAGAMLGYLATAVVTCGGAPVTQAMLPAALGMFVTHCCVRVETNAVTGIATAVLSDREALPEGA